MILNLDHFIKTEKLYWVELEGFLKLCEEEPSFKMDLAKARRFHYLYQRVASDLSKVVTFASEKELASYLENLMSRAYAQIHQNAGLKERFRFSHWFLKTFPQTFRKHIWAFRLIIIAFLAGSIFGAAVLRFDPGSKPILLGPFSHLYGAPSERVQKEESGTYDKMKGAKSTFAAELMTHNIKVSLFSLALGMTWGIGTLIILFYNGVILGAVAFDYIADGQTTFLLGWLLPHGSIEIPAFLLAGQAGLILGRALIGKGKRLTLKERFREILPDVVTLIGGVALMLVWAGIVESFLSQYHQPVLPYFIKITFGALELGLLFIFLKFSGRKNESENLS